MMGFEIESMDAFVEQLVELGVSPWKEWSDSGEFAFVEVS